MAKPDAKTTQLSASGLAKEERAWFAHSRLDNSESDDQAPRAMAHSLSCDKPDTDREGLLRKGIPVVEVGRPGSAEHPQHLHLTKGVGPFGSPGFARDCSPRCCMTLLYRD